MTYNQPLSDYGDLMTVEDFKTQVRCGCFNDYDGMGKAVKDRMMVGGIENYIYPSGLDRIPADATHIMWFNK